MQVLVLYAHPVETSFSAAVHQSALDALRAGGHTIDDCDLYAEGFDPVLSRQERLDYHDLRVNTTHVADYVERLRRAEGLVLCFPIWSFGPPAILKGFFDRILIPGVAFSLSDKGDIAANLQHIRRIAGIVTYGQTRLASVFMGDPPRKYISRALKWCAHPRASVTYLAHYNMNKSTDQTRRRFLNRVERVMGNF